MYNRRKLCVIFIRIFFRSSKYSEVHRKIELVASVTSLTNSCIEFLKKEITKSKDESRVRSAYFTLIEIFMNNTCIDKKWLELFQEAFELVIDDRTFNNHVKVFIKYLKILNHLKKYEMVLTKSVEMLSIYPNEYFPLDMICRIYSENFAQPEFPFDVSFGSASGCVLLKRRPIWINAYFHRKLLALALLKNMRINFFL